MRKAFRITGKVQGVFFRASTREQALRLGLKGLARNESDGSVTVVAEGDAAAITELAEWLQHGPANAEVADVQELSPPAETLANGFTTG